MKRIQDNFKLANIDAMAVFVTAQKLPADCNTTHA